MRRATRWGILAAALAAVGAIAALAGTTGSHAAPAAKKTVIIGWAFDQAGQMAPFDNPALAAAKIRIKQINAKGKYRFVINTCDTQNNDAAKAKACALSLLGQGAKIIFTTCDVDYATPVVQETINRGKLAIAPCIGTDQMGPRRFGKKGKLAFSFGNVAQDEGSAMAELAWKHGWKTADLAKDTVIVYFKAVVTAFKARFQQLGGKINYETSYQDPALQPGSSNFHNAASNIAQHPAKVIVTVTSGSYQAQLPFITDLRTAGNNTPILNSWAGDGTYWLPKGGPKVTNYWYVTYANAFGHDPNPAVNALANKLRAANPFDAATGGFVTGPAAIDGLVTAIKRANGSLVGSKLAAVMQKFHKVPTLSGNVSFSAKLHTVFGRQYRVVEINNNKPIAKGTVTAKVVPNSPDS